MSPSTDASRHAHAPGPEREILLTGIGGQGIQLAAQVLARAATGAGLHAMFLGVYLGSMRGGNSDATVVIGPQRLQTPPLVSRAWAAVAMHHEHWAGSAAKLRPGGIVVVDEDVFDASVPIADDLAVVGLPCSSLAAEVDAPGAATVVALGAFIAVTDIAPLADVAEALRASLPSYRHDRADANARALSMGHDTAVDRGRAGTHRAWPDDGSAGHG